MFVKRYALGSLVVLLAVGFLGLARAETTVGPQLGTWELVGKDKREWKATLVFTKRIGTKYEGYFKWLALSGEPSSGHEPFEGIFNPTTRLITLKGLDMQDKTGNIATGSIYEATVSEDGYHLRDGKWFGQNVLPGTWTAIWKNGDTPKP